MFRSLCEAGGTCLEGILVILIVALMEGEAGLLGRLPLVALSVLGIATARGVVVDDYLVHLPVALTG